MDNVYDELNTVVNSIDIHENVENTENTNSGALVDSCEFCKYSKYSNEFDGMECRRCPPQAEVRWPDVSNDDWCGEFKRR